MEKSLVAAAVEAAAQRGGLAHFLRSPLPGKADQIARFAAVHFAASRTLAATAGSERQLPAAGLTREGRDARGESLEEALRWAAAAAGCEASVKTHDRRGWEGVVGLGEAKQALVESLEWPQAHRELLDHFLGAGAGAGSVLLFGAPGTGKTSLARAAAAAMGATLLELKATDVVHSTGDFHFCLMSQVLPVPLRILQLFALCLSDSGHF
jgi:hypothetical protein